MSSLNQFNSFEEMCENPEIQAMVHTVASKFYGSLDQNEIESEINLTLFEVWKKFDERRGKVSTYLFRALRNNLAKLSMKYQREYGPHMSYVTDDILPTDNNRHMKFELLDGLSKKQKSIVNQHVFQELGFDEIAENHGLDEELTKRIYESAIKLLKKYEKD